MIVCDRCQKEHCYEVRIDALDVWCVSNVTTYQEFRVHMCQSCISEFRQRFKEFGLEKPRVVHPPDKADQQLAVEKAQRN